MSNVTARRSRRSPARRFPANPQHPADDSLLQFTIHCRWNSLLLEILHCDIQSINIVRHFGKIRFAEKYLNARKLYLAVSQINRSWSWIHCCSIVKSILSDSEDTDKASLKLSRHTLRFFSVFFYDDGTDLWQYRTKRIPNILQYACYMFWLVLARCPYKEM